MNAPRGGFGNPVGGLPKVAALLLLLAATALHVTAETTDASKTVAAPTSLTTAGVLTSFSITAKDESGATRTSGGDNFIVELEGTRSISGSVVDNLDGSYKVSFTATKSGTYEASVKLAKNGGLSAAYYENVWFFYTPVKRTVDPMIDMDWGTGLITATGADYISIRWTGKLKPLYSEPHTFFVTTDDGSRLWVDNVPLIDRWDSYSNDTSATIALKANVFYAIKMEYKEVTGTAYAKLRWASASTPKETVPSSVLYYETHIYQSPFSVSVVPSSACGSQSTAAGDGLVMATAGTAAQLTIQSNDEYQNELGVGGDIFSVRVGPSALGQRPVHAVVVDETDSSYSIEYTPYVSGDSVLNAQLLSLGSMAATYYDTSDFKTPLKATTVTSIDMTATGSITTGGYYDDDAEFSIRYRGFLKPTQDAVYTFSFNRDENSNSWATMIVDNQQIISLPKSSGATELSSTIQLRSVNYYQVDFEFKSDGGAAARSFKFQWGAGGLATVSSSNMFVGSHIEASPFSVTVSPARTSAAKSTASDSSTPNLCLATAGLQAQFTVTARDLYNNLRAVGGESWKVRLTGSDSTAGAVQDLGTGEYKVIYTVTQSGTYDISVVYGASGIAGSPFRIYAQPSNRHLPNSVATGQSLTLATAGVGTVMTLTVKDRHDNQQPGKGIYSYAGMTFQLADSTKITTTLPSCSNCDSQTISQSCPDECPGYKNSPGNKMVAVPTTGDRSTYVMRYLVTRSGVFQLQVKGGTTFEGQVKDSPFPLTIFPHIPCATTSTATGTSLSLVTAGMPSTFTIQSRDKFYNERGSHVGDKFVAFIRQQDAAYTLRDHHATVVDNGDSTYTLSYVATKSQTNKLWAQLANQGGVMASKTIGAASTANVFSPLVSIALADNLIVRFKGFFRPTIAGQYTFKIARADTGVGADLRVDNLEIISKAQGAGSASESGTLPGLVANRFYDLDLKFNYASGSGGSGNMFLQYQGQGQTAFKAVGTGSLFTSQHVSGSPFSVVVKPTIACSTTSSKEQMAVSLSTAGTAASFTMQTRDEFSNLREIGGDPWNFALLQGASVPQGSTTEQDDSKDMGTSVVQGTATYVENGGYHIQYTPTLEGDYQLRGKILQPGGLYGEYFENDDLTDHGKFDSNAVMSAFHRVDAAIDFDWKNGQPVDEASTEFSSWLGKKKIGPDFFSVRWTGQIKPQHTEVYTFSAEVDDGIRVWVDGLLIMDYWYVHSQEVDGTIALMGDQLYSIKVEYRDMTGSSIVRFRWRSKTQEKQVVPSSSLYHATTSKLLSWPPQNTPDVVIEPTVVCASTSHAEGEGLTIATAGTTSYFTIQSRDEYNNVRKLGDAPDFHVRVVPVPAGNQRLYHASLTGLSHSGIQRLPSERFAGGLTATYYVSPKRATCQEQPWHNTYYCQGDLDMSSKAFFWSPTGSVPTSTTGFQVRYKGFFRPSQAGVYTFSLIRAGAAASALSTSLQLADSVLIATSSTVSAASTTSIASANAYYAIQLDYAVGGSAQAGFIVKYKGPGNAGMRTFTTDRLFPLAGRYKVHYTPIVKTDYSVQIGVAHPGGLDATYYDDQELTQPVGVVTHSSIDMSSAAFQDASLPRHSDDGGFGAGVRLSDMSSFSARFEGFFKPTLAETTFQLKFADTDERVKLWVDNQLLIDRWNTYEKISATSLSQTISLVSTAGAQVSGSDLQLGDGNCYFDLKLEYKQMGKASGIKLYSESSIISSSNLFFNREISGSPFPPMEAQSAPTCSSKSSVRGSALTEATAGMPNSFTIQSHDEYYNERGLPGDYYFVRLHKQTCTNCPVYVFGSVVDEGDSSYVATYNATKAGAYKALISLASPGGLFATYYNSGGAVAVKQEFLTNAVFTSHASYTTLRYEGFVRPTTAGLYTFTLEDNDAAFSSKLYVENMDTAVEGTTQSNNVLATYNFPTANSLYLLKFDFIRDSGSSTPTLSLKWATGGASAALVTTSNLYTLRDVPNTQTVTVRVEDTDAATSHASGGGLTVATAGHWASFTLTAKDSFANKRMLDEDTWLVQVSGPDVAHTVRAMHDSSAPAKAGTYHVKYMTTISGSYDVTVSRAMSGGLQAEYFNNMWLLGDPAHTTVDKEVDFFWGTSTIQPTGAPASIVLGSDYMSVRWSGFIMPELNEEYTFHTQTDEGVRLYVDGSLVIDQWESQATNFSATWGDFTPGALYALKMEYRESTEAAFARLLFSSDSIARQPVPEDVLFHSTTQLFGSPFKMYAYPAITCAASSTVEGTGLSFATTGNRASFTIQAKDQYHNVKTQWVADSTEVFVVRSRSDSNGDASKLGTVTHNVVKGKWNVVFQPTRCGATSIYTSLIDKNAATGRGVLATYYSTTDLSGSPQAVGGFGGDFSGIASGTYASGSSFSARFAGMFKATATGQNTFHIIAGNAATVVHAKVFVNNKLVVDMWGTVNNDLSATTHLPSTSEWYDLVVEYSDNKASSTFGVKNAATVLGTTHLFRALDVSNSPYQFVTQPDVTAWTKSTTYGEALTIATAGVTGQFTIQSKDLNNNKRDTGGDEYLVHAASSTGAAFSGTVEDMQDGTYVVKYTPSRQGAYTLKLYMGTSDMTTSLHVQPGAAFGPNSVANSNQLTIATAGHMATFTIQAKDEYKNLRTIESNDWIVRLSTNSTEEHNNFVRYIGGHPFNPTIDQLGKFEVHYRTTASGQFNVHVQLAEGNGLDAWYYRDETLNNAALSRRDSTVSFNWGSGSPSPSVGIVDGFSAKWSGYVKPALTEELTFTVNLASDDRVKLWVDDHYIIDKWDASPGTTTAGTIKLASNTLYDIKMYYKDIAGDAAVKLLWKGSSGSATEVPSTRLFSGANHIAGSPFTATVFPSVTSGALSTVAGPGLTLATAGIGASFTVTAKDHLGNEKTTADDFYVVRARNRKTDVRDIGGTVAPLGNGRYSVVYTPTLKQHEKSNKWDGSEGVNYHDVLVSLAQHGGLFATYFDTTNANLRLASAPKFLNVLPDLTGVKPVGPGTTVGDNQFGVRYAGFIRPAYAELYTFIFTRTGSAEVSMDVDGKNVFGTNAQSGTIQFMVANHFYDVLLWYDNKNEAGSTLKFEYKSNSHGASNVVVPSSRLFQSYDLTFKTMEAGGLFATYFDQAGMTASGSTGMYHTQDPYVDWSGASTTDRPHPFSVPAAAGAWSVRWEGFIRPSRSDRYTFHVLVGGSHADQKARLWVDPDNMDFSAAGTLLALASTTSKSATIQFAAPNDVYNIRLEYEVTSASANRGVTLQYENDGKTYSMYGITAGANDTVSKQVVPEDRLFKTRASPSIRRDDLTNGLWSFDANACLGVAGHKDEARWRECRGHGNRINDVLHVDVKPAVASATRSTINLNTGGGGIMVSLSTAGAVRYFEVNIRDEYNNFRDSFDQGIISRQYLQENTDNEWPFTGKVAAMPTSSTLNDYDRGSVYKVTYLVTRSGDFWNEVALADTSGNGLFGTYFMKPTLSGGAVTRVDASVDFNWGTGSPTADGVIPADAFSARWVGYIRPQLDETYTLYVKADSGVQLTLGNTTVIDQWAATTATEFSGTINLEANVLHDISLQYKHSTGSSYVELRYSSPSTEKQIVPRERLYPLKETIGSSADVGGGYGMQVLKVYPAALSATVSNVDGDGLTIATTGVVATFVINSRDEYSNMRTRQDTDSDCNTNSAACLFKARIVPDSPTSGNPPKLGSITTHATSGRSTFAGAYSYTRSGTYNVHVASRSGPGGLSATYYDDGNFAVPRRASTGSLPDVSKSAMGAPTSLSADGSFTVRWAGFFEAWASTPVTVTRREPVKVWINDILAIDKWVEEGSDVTTSATITGLTASEKGHSIRVEYKATSTAANALLKLHLNGAGIHTHTSRLFSSYLITGEPKRLRMNPNVADAKTSTSTGNGLTIGTAGTLAKFTVTSKDAYHNERGKGGDIFVARALPTACAATACGVHQFVTTTTSCSGCPNVVRGSVTDNGDDTYSASFTPTKKGTYKVVSSLATLGGLTATYFQAATGIENVFSSWTHAGLTKATKISEGVPVDFSSANDAIPHAAAGGAIRWHGFIRPSRASEYTFYVSNFRSSAYSEKVRLWVDNTLVIDAATGMGANELSGTIGFGSQNTLYDIQVAYLQVASAISGISLKWESTGSAIAAENQYKARLPSSRMYTRDDVMPSNYLTGSVEMTVHPASGCATKSVATGDALTLSTAGTQVTFTVSSKDAYENDRSKTADMAWVALLYGSGGTPTVQGDVASSSPNVYKVSYTTTVAKNYELFAKYNNDNSHGSPFSLTTLPAILCGSKSTVTGSGLTSAIVNTAAQFTVQARDEFANAKTKKFTAGEAAVTTFLLSYRSFTSSDLTAQIDSHQSFGASQTVAYVDGSSANGRYVGTYTVGSAPSGTTFTHVSLGIAGGLLATYYDVVPDGANCPAFTYALHGNTHIVAKKTGIDTMAAGAAVASCSAAANCGSNTFAASNCYAARFAGFLKVTTTTTATFKADGTKGNHYIWVDGSLVMNAPSASTSTTMSLTANRYYEVFFKFGRKDQTTAGSHDIFGGITTAHIFAAMEVSGSPFDLTVTS